MQSKIGTLVNNSVAYLGFKFLFCILASIKVIYNLIHSAFHLFLYYTNPQNKEDFLISMSIYLPLQEKK